MSGEDYLFMITFRLVMQSPLLIVAIIGLWFALSRRKNHLRAFTWASWGFGLLMGYSAAQVIIQVTLAAVPAWLAEEGTRMTSETAMAMSLWSFASYPLFIGGLAALARAVFLGREEVNSTVVASAA
jgi:hypothetical protein